MIPSSPRFSLDDIQASPESAWIVDGAVLRCAGEPLHCALVQDLKSQRVLGWATALEADPALMLRAVELACQRHPRTRPTLLYLDAQAEHGPAHVIAALTCLEIQLRFLQGQEQWLLKPLAAVWSQLQAGFDDQEK